MQDSYRFFGFSPAALEVDELAPPPVWSNHASLLADTKGGGVLLLPGRSVENSRADGDFLYLFSFQTGWRRHSATPAGLASFEGRGVWQSPQGGDEAFFFGGQNAAIYAVTPIVWRLCFSFNASSWDEWGTLPHAGFGFSVAAIPAKGSKLSLFVVGGSLCTGAYCMHDAFIWDVPAQSARTRRTRQKPRIVAAFWGPFPCTGTVQEIVDAGYRGVHMGRVHER